MTDVDLFSEVSPGDDIYEQLAALLDDHGDYRRAQIYTVDGTQHLFLEHVDGDEEQLEQNEGRLALEFSYRWRAGSTPPKPPPSVVKQISAYRVIADANPTLSVMCTLNLHFDLEATPDVVQKVGLPIDFRSVRATMPKGESVAGDAPFDLITAFSGAKFDPAGELYSYTFDFSKPDPHNLFLSLDYQFTDTFDDELIQAILRAGLAIADGFVAG